MPCMMQVHLLLLVCVSVLLFVPTARSECPRKGASRSADDRPGTVGLAKAPGVVPQDMQISCTYMHNDKSEMDQHFSDDVLAVLSEIVQRLQQELRLSLTVEKVNCAEQDEPRCSEYSLDESFHWLIVDDPKHGAAVYEISSKLNSRRPTIEASLLDALSRHSVHDLTTYCSKEADKEVGFVRRLTTEELTEKRRNSMTTKRRNAILRSPFELDLIEPLLLELRTFNKPIIWHRLQRMDAEQLNNAISEDKLTFVLFWNGESILSQHAFYLWAEASKTLVPQYPEARFGAVACHEFEHLCEDYVTTSSEQHTILVFKTNDIFARNQELRDPKYYLEWVHILMLASVQEINSDDELKQIKNGKLESFDEIRPAITIGIFNDRNCVKARVFKQVAENLKGKYHFVIFIKNSHPNAVYTIRAKERKKRIDFTGTFDVDELTSFVMRSSLPTVIDITNGFTSDILTHQPLPIVLLIDGNEQEKMSFSNLCAKSSNVICTDIRKTGTKAADKVLHSLQTDGQSKLFVFLREKIFVVDIKSLKMDNLRQLVALAVVSEPLSVLGMNDVHPLRHLQLAQINKIFGEQPVEIPSEFQIIQRAYQEKMFEMDADGDDYGGCPVMAQMKNTAARDEL